MTAFILAGGLGTRLRPVLQDRPKVLAEVAGRPFLTFLLDQLVEAGVKDCVLGIGYLAEQVKAALGGSYRTITIRYSQEEKPLGTGGAIRHALPLLDAEIILAMNGDSYCDADLVEFQRHHLASGAKASLLLVPMVDCRRFGSVELKPDGQVSAFREKDADSGPGWINAGVYLIERALIETIPRDRAVSIEREVFPEWIGRGLYGAKLGRSLLDIGTPESLAAAEAFLRKHRRC